MGESEGRIGAFTHGELMDKVQALARQARGASQQQAGELLEQAHALISTIREELGRDHAELARKRTEAAHASAEIQASFAESDQAREAMQAQQIEELQRRLEATRKDRSEQSLWTRLTTRDVASQEVLQQIEATEQQHDAEDARDRAAREALVQAALAPVRPYEKEAAATQAVLDEAQAVVTLLVNRAAGWGEGSQQFTRIERIVEYGREANARDQDAKAFMAVTAALTGRSIEVMNRLHDEMKQLNYQMSYRHKLTDVEALATLACAAAAAAWPAERVMELWCDAVDHAYREGGYSNDEDARSMVVFCAAVGGRPVDEVQWTRRATNVDNFRGQDPEGAGLILLTHTLSRRPIPELVAVYHAAARAGLPMEERGYMAMAAGLGGKQPEAVVARYRGLDAMVRQRVPLPWSWEDKRDAIREAAATLTIAAAISPWRDEQLIELYNMTASFRPTFGKPDYEARGGLVIGAVAPACKL